MQSAGRRAAARLIFSSHVDPISVMPLVELYGHERLREQFSAALARGALPASLLLHGQRGVGKQRLALWLAQVLLCAGANPRPCSKCSQCRFTFALAHPDLHWVFPRPRLKNSDPSLEDVKDDYAEAIAERVGANGLYGPPSGSDGIFVATVRAIVREAVMSPALATPSFSHLPSPARCFLRFARVSSPSVWLRYRIVPFVSSSLIQRWNPRDERIRL